MADMMPSADDVHVPILWSKKDLAWLQASPLKDDTERDLANLKEDYTQARGVCVCVWGGACVIALWPNVGFGDRKERAK